MKSRVTALLDQALALPELSQKKIGCLVGAAVADAASRPLHWIYDLPDLEKAIKADPERPEFVPKSKSPFYTLPTGENSCYFDQCFAVMTSIRNQGQFDFEDVCSEFVKQLGPNSQYDMQAREEYMELRRYGRVQGPIVGKWLHGGMIKFLANKEKSDSLDLLGDPHIKETDGFCCALPVVVRHAGDTDLMEKVMKVATTQSTWPVAVRHAAVAAKIIEAFIQGDPDPFSSVGESSKSEFPEIYKELQTIKSMSETPHTEAVGYVFGRPCYNPGSFMGAIHAVQTSESFQEAVRKTIKAGGCNCSRAFFIGGMVGARDGLAGIPREWILKTSQAENIIETAIHMVKD